MNILTSPTLNTLSQNVQEGKKILYKKVTLYGNPGSGKTLLASTAALSKNINKIYWFDCDKSIETLIYDPTNRLTTEAKEKIIPFNLSGSSKNPKAAETLVKAFTSNIPVPICYEHGDTECKVRGCPSMKFSLYSLGVNDLVVIDPGSKVAELLFAMSAELNVTNNKQQWWGDFYGYMDDVQSAILDCPTNIIWVSHEMDIMRTIKTPGPGNKMVEKEVLDIRVPMCGSRNYSKKFSKDYGYKILTYMAGSKFKATVTPGEQDRAIVGARKPINLYDAEGLPSLVPLFDTVKPLTVEQTPSNGNSLTFNLKK